MSIVVRDIYNYRQIWWLDKFLIGHKGYIAGGCFKNIFNNEQVNDIDMFFECEADFKDAQKYFKKQLEEKPSEIRFSYENKNVWAVYFIKEKVRVELIRKTFGKPKNMISDFDFTITKFAYYKNYDNVDEDDYLAVYEVAFHEDFFEHLHTKRLVIDDDLPYPVSTFNRMMKYAKYGYQPCRETKIRMITELAELSIDDKDFEEQLGKSFYEGMD